MCCANGSEKLINPACMIGRNAEGSPRESLERERDRIVSGDNL